MTLEQKETVIQALVNFIVKATSKDAKPEEVQVLPALVNAFAIFSGC